MKAVCIIPARAGSKRIPGKNWKEFFGKPIILYPFHTAIESGIFDKVLVYTNDRRIEDMIPIENQICRVDASDEQTLAEMLEEVVPMMDNVDYDTICVMLPTAVFTTIDDLNYCFNKLNGSNPLQLNGMCSVSYYGEDVDWGRDKNGRLYFNVPYRDAGNFYFIRTEAFLRQKSLIGQLTNTYELNAIDINTQEDWDNAERLYAELLGR
jgi:N-acylneuraminate cytidylyltransferase